MKKIIFIIFLLPILLFGQNFADKNYYLVDNLVLDQLTKADRILLDSCLGVYHNSKKDTIKIEALNKMCDNLVNDIWGEYQFVQYELIEQSLKKEITDKEKDVILYFKGGALNNLGLYYEYQKGNSSKALDYYLKSLTLYEELKDKQGMAMMYNRLGAVYTFQDNPDKGFEYFQKSLKIYRSLNDQKEVANPLNSIGLYYVWKGNKSEALEYFKESLKIDLVAGNNQGIGTSHSNIGRVYLSKKDYDKALISFIKGLKIFEKWEINMVSL